MEQAEGAIVGDFELVKKIGQGSSGTVWVGRKENSGDDLVVIKIIPLSGWRKLEFEREVEALETLKHAHIVEIIEWFVESKMGVVVIEMLDRDLLDFLDDFTISEAEARMMFKQILLAIGHLHQNNTAHMDIKPENVLISGSDLLKVADLGSTYQWGSNIFRTGKAGTSFYCAPEVKSGKPYRPDKADIWSLGITLHVMMTGFWPYLGQTEKEVLSHAKKGKIDIAEQSLSKPLLELMKTMLQLDPEVRPSIDDILSHSWFAHSDESIIAFTPRGEGVTSVESLYSTTSMITDSGEEELQDQVKSEGVVVPSIKLPELSLDGLKSPRMLKMMTPRVGGPPNSLMHEEGLIRPSPRGMPNQNKQTKLGKILHNFRKGIASKRK